MSVLRHGQLWDPMDCSPPGSSVRAISQARILELLFPPPEGIFPTQGSNLHLLHLAGRFFTTELSGKPVQDEKRGAQDATQHPGAPIGGSGPWPCCSRHDVGALVLPPVRSLRRCPEEAVAGTSSGPVVSHLSVFQSWCFLLPINQYCLFRETFGDTFLLLLHGTGFAKLLALPTAWIPSRHSSPALSTRMSSACSLSPGSTGTSLATPMQHFPSPRVISKDSCKAGRLCLTLKTKPPLVDAGGSIVDCMNKVGGGEERKRTSQLPLGLFFLIYLEVSEGQMHPRSHLRAAVGPGSRCWGPAAVLDCPCPTQAEQRENDYITPCQCLFVHLCTHRAFQPLAVPHGPSFGGIWFSGGTRSVPSYFAFQPPPARPCGGNSYSRLPPRGCTPGHFSLGCPGGPKIPEALIWGCQTLACGPHLSCHWFIGGLRAKSGFYSVLSDCKRTKRRKFCDVWKMTWN